MSTTTTNLNLVKPEGSEYVDVDIINDNMDIIDTFAGEVSVKPKINNVELSGNKTSADLLLADRTHTHVISDITNLPTIPSKTSDLTNDSNFVSDSSYVHTDANFTTAEKTKLAGVAANANNYTLPVATTSTLGGIKPDGTTISVDANGVATVIGGGGGGGGTTVVANPQAEATDDLEKLQVGTTVYEIPSGGTGFQEVTRAEYDALTPAEKALDIVYSIIDENTGGGESGNIDANDVGYDNSSTGLLANSVQDAIDEVSAKSANIVAPVYSSSSAYAIGDYCTHNNILYKCNTTIATGEVWTIGHWTVCTVMSEMEQSGGSSYVETSVYTGSSSGNQDVILDIETEEEFNRYNALCFEWEHGSGILTVQTYPISEIKATTQNGANKKIEKNTTGSDYLTTVYGGLDTSGTKTGIKLSFTAPSGYTLNKIIAIKY